jgi:hypothetical protein
MQRKKMSGAQNNDLTGNAAFMAKTSSASFHSLPGAFAEGWLGDVV